MSGNGSGAEVAPDRRTVLKASGLAAAGGALGLAAEPVVADEGNEHYVVASDAHLGSPFSNSAAFETFLREEVPEIGPDALVLNGDVVEMWFRGMASALLEFTGITSYLAELQDSGTDVIITAGNHDRRFVSVGENAYGDLTPGEPWQIGNEYYFESGGRSFVAAHGDEGDPLQVDPVSSILCLTDDSIGGLFVELYDWFTGRNARTVVGEGGTTTVTATDPDWQTLSFANDYKNGIIVTSPVEARGGPPVQTRVQNPRRQVVWYPGRTEIRLESWGTPFGRVRNPDDRVQYAVFRDGAHAIGRDARLAVGRVTADGEWTSVSFEEPFETAPEVFTEVQSTNSNDEVRWTLDPSRATVRNVTASGFEVRVHETEAGPPAAQEVGFVATKPGRTTNGGGILEVGTTDVVDPGGQIIGFEQEFDEVATLLVEVQAADGTPVVSQYQNLDGDSVELSFRTADGPLAGAAQVSYLVLGDSDEFYTLGESELGTTSTDPEQQWRDIVESLQGIDASELPDRPPGMAGARDGRFSTQASVAQRMTDIYPDSFVVFGHTHIPTVGDRYVNGGAWTSRGGSNRLPENCYVEIESGDITVWNWSPDDREVLFDP